MSVTFMIATLLLASSPLVLRIWYGAHWTIRPFSIFALTAVVYHLVTEILIRATGVEKSSSERPPLVWLDNGMLIAAVTLLAMTLGYMLFSPRKCPPLHGETNELSQQLDWRFSAALTLPLLLATVQGSGYITGKPLDGEGVGITGLAMQFFIPLVILTAFGYLLRHPSQWLPTVAAQSAILVLAGQRLEVFIGALTLILLGARTGLAPKPRQVWGILIIAGLLALGITSVREEGRELFYSDSGAAERIGAIAQGITRLPDSATTSGLLGDAAIRISSNAWTGAIALAFDNGATPIGYRPLWTSVVSMVPSALYPNKIALMSLHERSPEQWTIDELGLTNVDYLPGHLTFFLGALGYTQLVIFMMFIGALMGVLDSWLLRSKGFLMVIAYVLVVQSHLFFERGLPYYLFAARAFIVLVPLFWLWGMAVRKFHAMRNDTRVVHPLTRWRFGHSRRERL